MNTRQHIIIIVFSLFIVPPQVILPILLRPLLLIVQSIRSIILLIDALVDSPLRVEVLLQLHGVVLFLADYLDCLWIHVHQHIAVQVLHPLPLTCGWFGCCVLHHKHVFVSFILFLIGLLPIEEVLVGQSKVVDVHESLLLIKLDLLMLLLLYLLNKRASGLGSCLGLDQDYLLAELIILGTASLMKRESCLLSCLLLVLQDYI